MTDKEILEKVYRRLQDVSRPENWKDMTMDKMFDRWHDLKDLIEREWQKQDDRQDDLEMKMLSENPTKKWFTDARDMERHRGLEIGPDGTVKSLD